MKFLMECKFLWNKFIPSVRPSTLPIVHSALQKFISTKLHRTVWFMSIVYTMYTRSSCEKLIQKIKHSTISSAFGIQHILHTISMLSQKREENELFHHNMFKRYLIRIVCRFSYNFFFFFFVHFISFQFRSLFTSFVLGW